MTRTLQISLVAFGTLFSSIAAAQDPPPPAPPPPDPAGPPTQAPSVAPPPTDQPAPPAGRKGGGPSLGLPSEAPQAGGIVVMPRAAPVTTIGGDDGAGDEWKFEFKGYFRAPMRLSWGKEIHPTTGENSTQIRTPPLVPDANYIDWTYTNNLVGPWTELNFNYGNSRAKMMVQIASYNITDAGYRRLEANLGINQAFLTLNFPEVFGDLGRFTWKVGAFTNRYGAAGRYDGGKYETYLFGRTHVAGDALTLEYDIGSTTVMFERTFGAKLEQTPFPGLVPNQPFTPYGGPVRQESTLVHSYHLGLGLAKSLTVAGHFLHVFANDELRAVASREDMGMPRIGPDPRMLIYGIDAKLLSGFLGDGYIGWSRINARNILYLQDAIEVIHSFGGWQFRDNFLGGRGLNAAEANGDVDTILFQHVLSLGSLLRYPTPFWGDGPDLILSIFGMYNRVKIADTVVNKLKAGGEVTYLPLRYFGFGGRYDLVQPNLDNSDFSFSVVSPRAIFRTQFVTHEQVIISYSRYFNGSLVEPGPYPFIDKVPDNHAFQIAAIIWW
jgi:hypothetical protein